MSRYFDNFPTINYNGANCVNLMARVRFADRLKKDLTVFYPYSMKENERMDSLSFNYYDDADFDWLLYISNDIIDPYYQVYLSELEFEQFILDKYGSTANAQSTIAFYRNNWAADSTILTTSGYAALDASVKKFWSPVLTTNKNISSYVRNQQDWEATTNQIVTITNITLTSNTVLFQDNEKVLSSANGYAYVADSNTSVLVLKHINGSFPNTSYTVTGQTSNAVATVANNQTTATNIIAPLDQVYFAPIDNYTFEREQNEQNKELLVLDKRYATDVYKTFKTLMKQ